MYGKPSRDWYDKRLDSERVDVAMLDRYFSADYPRGNAPRIITFIEAVRLVLVDPILCYYPDTWDAPSVEQAEEEAWTPGHSTAMYQQWLGYDRWGHFPVSPHWSEPEYVERNRMWQWSGRD